jgi:hypothetical protein
VPTPPPTPSKIKTFEITVAEITAALNHTHAGHPLENLIIEKVLAIFQKDHLSIVNNDIVYDGTGDTIVLQNDSCKLHVQLDNGWTTHAVLKAPTAVAVQLGVDAKSLVVGADVRLDTAFHVAGNIHLAEGSSAIHPPGKPCSIIGTENSRETIDGDMDIQTNITLHLKPTVVGNRTSGYHLRFVPTVKVAGKLVGFDAKTYSHISVFGIKLTKISALVNIAINTVLREAITDKLVQKELAKMQVKLQSIASTIWPAGSAGNLPGITPDLLTQMEAAVTNLGKTQAGQYP